MNSVCKNYKPEIIYCPKCNARLEYKYPVSNKLVYFSSGKRIRVRNLGYACPNCKDGNVYVSQTATKLCFKGYTYSAKIVCLISLFKEKHMSREEICDYFYSKNIEISDRNVDNLYAKYIYYHNLDYTKTIFEAYEKMLLNYNEIRLSIDLITINGTIFVLVYDYFTTELLALQRFESVNDSELPRFLSSFLKSDLNITVIASIRRDANFIPLLKKICSPKTKFIAFNKF